MDLLVAANTVPLANADRPPAPGSPGVGAPGYATDGNPATGVQPTSWPASAFNPIVAELVNLLVVAGFTPNGNDWTQVAQAVARIGRRRAEFTANGSFVVPEGVSILRVYVTGGGAGGAGCNNAGNPAGGGGGAGGTAISFLGVAPGAVFPITVGAGGAGGGVTGQPGGSSSFGTALSATGGQAGASGANPYGGLPGMGIGGNEFVLSGGAGADGNTSTSLAIPGGQGGASYWGPGSTTATGGQHNATNPGSGGGGAYNSASAPGGAGAGGIVVVEF